MALMVKGIFDKISYIILWCTIKKNAVTRVFEYLYPPNYSVMSEMQHKVNFQVAYNWFDFRVFLILDWLTQHG